MLLFQGCGLLLLWEIKLLTSSGFQVSSSQGLDARCKAVALAVITPIPVSLRQTPKGKPLTEKSDLPFCYLTGSRAQLTGVHRHRSTNVYVKVILLCLNLIAIFLCER